MLDNKLAELTNDGGVRSKVQAVLQDLSAHGERPKIFEAKRTVEQQREKVRLGYSKTMRSSHLKRGSDGGALAADIADKSLAWNATKRFWLMLGSSAMTHGLGWGGLFGLNRKQQIAVVNAIRELRTAGWPPSHEAYQCQLGWDTAHVQQGVNWP